MLMGKVLKVRPFTYLPITAVHGRPTVAWFGPLHATPFATAKGVSTLLLHVTELPGMACSWAGDRHVTVAAGTRDLKCHDYGTMHVGAPPAKRPESTDLQPCRCMQTAID